MCPFKITSILHHPPHLLPTISSGEVNQTSILRIRHHVELTTVKTNMYVAVHACVQKSFSALCRTRSDINLGPNISDMYILVAGGSLGIF